MPWPVRVSEAWPLLARASAVIGEWLVPLANPLAWLSTRVVGA